MSTLPARGFTLVEVLVSLFVLALMAGMAWQGVDMVSRSREATQRRMDGLLRVQSTVAQWETDLAAVVDTQLMPGLAFDGATLHLTRRQPEGVQVVAWALRGGQLQRWAAPPVRSAERLQDAWFRSYQLLGNEPDTLTLLPQVSSWQIYVFFSSSNAWSNALSSGDVADNSTTAPAKPTDPQAATGRREQLPDGLRLVLTLADGASAGTGTLTREVRLIHP